MRKKFLRMRHILALWFCMSLCAVEAQDVQITKIERNYTSLFSSMYPEYDNNGTACALLRCYVRDDDTVIEPNLGVLKSEVLSGEIRLWVPVGTKRITVRMNGKMPLIGYNIPIDIESKVDYDVYIVEKEIPGQREFFQDWSFGVLYTSADGDFSDRIAPNVQFCIGYKFFSLLAARLQVNGWQARGMWNSYIDGVAEWTAIQPQVSQELVTYANNLTTYKNDYKYKHLGIGLNLMFNVTNALLGSRSDRGFDLWLTAGGGVSLALNYRQLNDAVQYIRNRLPNEYEVFYYGDKVRPYWQVGVNVDFRLAKQVSVILDVNTRVLKESEAFPVVDNGKIIPNIFYNALVGFRFGI